MVRAGKRSRSGFTLVELLVVIAIIGVLVALLLPAVQAAREAANRMSCGNNLKQIGLSLHNYHDTYKVFPPALIGSGRAQDVTRVLNYTGWQALLPFAEQQPLYDKFNLNVCSNMSTFGTPGTPVGDDTVNGVLTGSYVPWLECPSSPQVGETSTDTGGAAYHRRLGRRTSYLFATGDHTDYTNAYKKMSGVTKGIFGNDGAAKMASITDGTSNTIAVGEAASGDGIRTAKEYGPWGLSGTHTCCHGRAVSTVDATTGKIAPTATEARDWAINADWNGISNGKTYAWVFSSKHAGGAQFVFGDGHATFLPETIDYRTFCLLNYLRDGETAVAP